MSAQAFEFDGPHGYRLAGRLELPDGQPRGWAILAHCFTCGKDSLAASRVARALAAHGIGVLRFDFAGLGNSGGSFADTTFAADVDDLVAAGNAMTSDGKPPSILVGHSLGANVVCLYAGARPERVRRVVDLEGFGLAPAHPAQAPKRLQNWLDESRDPPQLKRYASLDEVAGRLIKTNPRLAPARAEFLAKHWSKPDGEGRFMLLADPAHKLRGPTLYRLDEVMAVWRKVSAKVLHVEAANSPTLATLAGEIPLDEFKARFQAFADWREKFIDEAGHMVHHDQPEQVAALIEGFCA